MSTAHRDTFARDNLPPTGLWPKMIFNIPEVRYSESINCASELLDRIVAEGKGGSPVIYFGNEVWSYQDLLDAANRIAHVLISDCGLVPGNRVLLRGPNTPMLAASWFGVLKAGGICVTTMPLLRAQEISYMIDKAQVSICLCHGEWLDAVREAQSVSHTLKQIIPYSTSEGPSLERLMERKPGEFSDVNTHAEDVALIAFTSGTTGKAKGTVHFHRDVLAICDCFPKSTLKASSKDIFIGTPPLGFTFGLGGLLLFPMRIGASSVFLEKVSPEAIVQSIERYRVSVLFSSPAAYRAMLDFVPKYNIKSLRKSVSAGETLPVPTFEAWRKATGLTMIDGIGSTEMLHIFISSREEEAKPGATGKPIPGYEAMVVDDSGKEVPAGTVGLLAVRGPTGCRYLSDPERQKEYVKNGWNITGDAYIKDEEGYFHFHTRADDMIIASGYNISGIEVENVLLQHPKVRECGVVGATDPDRGSLVKAYIVLRDSNDESPETVKELQEFVKATIAPYKYPRQIEFLKALPRTETGKLQRFRLRATN